MECQAMHKWSLRGLVWAFVDLSIAYLFLWASTIAYMASKFLAVLGLCLPCPCEGLFVAQPNKNLCFQKLFIDFPTEKVANVQLSVRTKFPFNYFMWGKDQNCNLNLRLIGEKERDAIQLEGEASCGSILDARKSSNIVRIKGELNAGNEVGEMKFLGTKQGRFDMKGKEIMHQKIRSGLRRRRKGGSDHGKYSSIPSYDSRFGEVHGDPESHPSVNEGGNELAADDLMVFDDEIYSHHDHEEAQTAMSLGQRFSNNFLLNEIHDEDEDIEKYVSSLRESRGNGQAGPSTDDKNTIRLLEQALREERFARTALYLELDKERSAAATAADEAMAMIQRLQKEKASIEMEARQYQRIIENKSAYDAEEMNILKEIIIRREWEKHFLEKEVEVYHQMMHLGNEQPIQNSGDILDSHTLDSLLDTNADPILMLQQLSASIEKKKGSTGALKGSSIQGWDESTTFGKQVHPTVDLPRFSVGRDDGNQELGDKMATVDNNSRVPPQNMASLEKLPWSSKAGGSLEKSPEENISLVEKGKEHMNINAEILERNIETLHIPSHCLSLEQSGNDADQGTDTSCNSSDKEPLVHDVHVIVNQSNSYNQIHGSKEVRIPQSSTVESTEIHMTKDVSSEASVFQRVSAVSDTPNSSNLDVEIDVNRCNSDMTCRLPPLAPNCKLLLSDPQKGTMSVVDYERLKIESEIEQLRERLRIVQEGRGKLNLPVEHREREKFQLKLLEDIAHQLQEIRQLTGPGKAVRQASLPLPSSKVVAKKRRCRSASLETHSSSETS